jgi:DNA segregation ATPase FtsK/SpoIIIE, S-DNA-T family
MMSAKNTLPAVPESDVLEGEIVDEPEARQIVVLRPVIVVLDTVRVVTGHEYTRRAGRHVSYIPIGAIAVAKRIWDARSTSRYDRMIRAAEATGNHEAALEWEARRSQFIRERHSRRMDVIALPGKALLKAPRVAGGAVAVLGGTGIMLAIATRHAGEVLVPFKVTAEIIKALFFVASVTWGPLLIAAPVVLGAVLWHIGRTNVDMAPGWAIASKLEAGDSGIVVTADTIVLALQNLDRIPALKRAFKDGWRPTFTLLPVRDGQGYSTVFGLPLGVTPSMIADQRAVFARNLHREEIEVWPSAGPPGFASLWVADSGAISKAAPEYPLLHEGTTDVFTGVPGGVVARGDAAMIPVVSNNMVAGGQMGQGKSNACRVFMLGCALDPLAELDVFVFANNGDFDAFAPRLARYVKGVEDETILAAVNRLHELYEDVARREARLAELGAKKVTRALAEQHPDMRPVVVLFSECHELFGHPEYGEIAAELATKTIKRARKTGISLAFDTQSSRKEAIPPKLVELVSVNACFYVKTWRSNDGFLGDGSFQAGIRATELRPGRDRGTSVVTGISDSQFELLRWYFIPVDDDTGYDAATEVIARAMKQLAPGTPVSGSVPVAEIESRDLLDDLDEVLGTDPEPVRLADLPPMLRKLAPTWGTYRSLTGVQLRELLDSEGVRTTNTGNVPRLDPVDLRHALSARALS